MSPFEKAFLRTVGHEKGYSNDPRDPGGETMYGISKRAHPDEDIPNMTLERAKLIYLRDYWQPARCSEMPEVIAAEVFDAAVNSGTAQAIRWAQRAAGCADDGVIGPVTLKALKADANPLALVSRMLGHRLQFYTDLSTWSTFGKGWARRVANNLKGAQ